MKVPTPDPGGQGESGQSTSGYTTTRRTFELFAIYLLGGIMSLAMAVPAAIYLLLPPRTPRRSGWIDAGDVGQLQPEMPELLIFQESRLDGWRAVTENKTAWVVKQ